jgi:hypothetical protein
VFCREMEVNYGLKPVLSPRWYLTPEQQKVPRFNQRKITLKENISRTLSTSHNYIQFEQAMSIKGYKVYKKQGIAFIDEKGVKIKGCEVGYPLIAIERIIAEKIRLTQADRPCLAKPVDCSSSEPGNRIKPLLKNMDLLIPGRTKTIPSDQQLPFELLKKRTKSKKQSLHL